MKLTSRFVAKINQPGGKFKFAPSQLIIVDNEIYFCLIFFSAYRYIYQKGITK
ncbi:MAG: hypothetical protein ACRAVC_19030 [Trichormus sp.]